MSVTFVSALLLELASVLLLWHRLGRGWWRRPGSLIVIASVVYNGVSPVLLTFPAVRAQDYFRIGIQLRYVDTATLIMAIGMLAFTLAYLFTRPESTMPKVDPREIRRAAQMLDWRVCACTLVPLAILTYQGRGYNSAGPSIGSGASLTTSLASTFFIILVALTAISILLRFGAKWFMIVLTIQSLLLAAAGERAPILINALVLLVLMARTGTKPSGRQVRITLTVAVLAMLAITGVRAERGRAIYNDDTGLRTRVTALGSGITSANNNILSEAAVRLDGVDFAGGILQAEALGDPRLSAWGVPESLLLEVPSVLWSSKLAHQGLNPGQNELNQFGMQQVNFLPGFAGMYMGFLPPAGLAVFLAVIGWVCGRGERYLFRYCTPVRLVMLAGAVECALVYEAGLPSMLTNLRAAAVIAVAVKSAEVIFTRRARGRVSLIAQSNPINIPQ